MKFKIVNKVKRGVLSRVSSVFHGIYNFNLSIIELNLTNKCNLKCKNCCSSCTNTPSNSYLKLNQVKKLVTESRKSKMKWRIIKLYGGEPTMHPNFFELLKIIKEYKNFNKNCDIFLLTNGVGKDVNQKLIKIPHWVKINNSTKMGFREKYKSFESFYVAPIDLKKYYNTDYIRGCWRIEECGISFNEHGFYSCSPGAHIDRVFGFDIGIKKIENISEEKLREQLNILCRYCGLFKEPRDYIDKEVISKTWKQKIKEYNNKKPKLSYY